MSLDAQGQEVLAAIIAVHGGVSVRIGSETGTGLRVQTGDPTQASVYGLDGTRTYVVRVSAETFSEPSRNAPAIVDGVQTYITNVRKSCGVMVLECSDTRPIEGVI